MHPSLITARCQFRDSKYHNPVALVSLPGSGNTWVRGLLEKATGICTGSIYCDSSLRINGFVGEYVCDSSVLVIKTHTLAHQYSGVNIETRNCDDALYGLAILLIRNPFDVFVAEWNQFRLRGLRVVKTCTKTSHSNCTIDDQIHRLDRKKYAGVADRENLSHFHVTKRSDFGKSHIV